MAEQEAWKSVVGHEEFYEVSDYGNVRSRDRVDRLNRVRRGQLLTPTGLRYLHVTLSNRGIKVQRTVHRLVLEAFIGPAPMNMEGCHWDGNPRNNRLDNLRWDTRRKNIEDAIRHGTFVGRGSTLNADAVREIRASKAAGVTHREMANKHGVTRGTIYAVVSGRTWKHVA